MRFYTLPLTSFLHRSPYSSQYIAFRPREWSLLPLVLVHCLIIIIIIVFCSFLLLLLLIIILIIIILIYFMWIQIFGTIQLRLTVTKAYVTIYRSKTDFSFIHSFYWRLSVIVRKRRNILAFSAEPRRPACSFLKFELSIARGVSFSQWLAPSAWLSRPIPLERSTKNFDAVYDVSQSPTSFVRCCAVQHSSRDKTRWNSRNDTVAGFKWNWLEKSITSLHNPIVCV